MTRRDAAPLPTADDGPVVLLTRERAELVTRLAELRANHEVLVDAGSGANIDDEHDPEGSTIAYERAQVDAVSRAVAQRLGEVEAALARVADGTFGTCEACGGPIGRGRLAARPAARTCIACAAIRR